MSEFKTTIIFIINRCSMINKLCSYTDLHRNVKVNKKKNVNKNYERARVTRFNPVY